MNEYTTIYLNGITRYIMADDWKRAISESIIEAKRSGFEPVIKYIVDGEGVVIKNIDNPSLTFSFSTIEKIQI